MQIFALLALVFLLIVLFRWLTPVDPPFERKQKALPNPGEDPPMFGGE
jgi:hypothetical protein